MAMHDQARLGAFEERLLDELKTVVAQRPVAARPSPRRALVLAAAGVAAVAVAAAVTAARTSPAYAVERETDGSVRVSVFDYRDPDGLRQRLAAYGITAAVDYLPAGRTCQEPRADYVPPDRMPRGLVDWEHPDGDATSFRVYPRYIGEGQTFVYTVQLGRHQQWAVIRLANGPVAPCVPV